MVRENGADTEEAGIVFRTKGEREERKGLLY